MRAEYLAALEEAEGTVMSAEALTRFATRYGEEPTRWAFAQIELRKKAAAKFEDADSMLFDRDGLQMATHEVIAEYHAGRFPLGVTISDLTCGIGSDLRAFGRRGPAIGYDTDPERLKIARWNCQGLPVELLHGTGLDADLSSGYAFADPSRRSNGERAHGPGDYEPNPKDVATHFKGVKLAGMKLSPMLGDLYLEGFGVCLEFVSYARECREALIWFGSEARPGRWAVLAATGERIPSSPAPKTVAEPTRFLLEADPAAIRAHALGGFGLAGLGDSNGYFTSLTPVVSPWLKLYRVLYTGPADPKSTRAALRDLGAGTPEIKVRGTKLDMAAATKELASDGKRKVTVVVWPVGRRLKHTIVESV
jgi:hypothetical protein